MNKIPMTLRGYQNIQEEIRHLKNVERPQIVDSIAAARSLGDLSENAEYHSAKDKQGMIEARISDLEEKISMAEIIDVSSINSDSIKFGATVEIVDEETDVNSTFQIVGSHEADIKNGLLPVTSPIARALIGKKSGDKLEVNTPSGVKFYCVLSVKYI